jgi:hypothetical protein
MHLMGVFSSSVVCCFVHKKSSVLISANTVLTHQITYYSLRSNARLFYFLCLKSVVPEMMESFFKKKCATI